MKNNGLNLYRVDAESNKALADRFDINSYPTIKWFKKGKFAGSYDYAREAEAIQQHFYYKSLDASTYYKCEDIDKEDAKNQIIYFGDLEDPMYLDAHLQNAEYENNKHFHGIVNIHTDADCA